MTGAIASYVVVAMASLLGAAALILVRLLGRIRSLTADRDTAAGLNTHLSRTLTATRATLESVQCDRSALQRELEQMRASMQAAQDELERVRYLRDVAEDQLHDSRTH